MRLQLILRVAPLAAILVSATPAAADGSLSVRGVYYKERATRVMQPMLDGMFDVGTRGILTAHFLVDAITSASSSSGADNAVPFTEKRYEGGVGYTHEIENLRLGGEAKYSTESDYRSIYFGVRGEMDLAQKNTTLGLGAGVSKDKISAAAAQGPSVPMLQCSPGVAATDCLLSVYSVYASASQILSPNLIVGATYDFANAKGYQSNPYRMALADDGIAAERHPTIRRRTAIAASVRYFIPQTQTTLIGAYRYYRDNWDVFAHTPEIRIVQQVGYSADATFRYRFYKQDAAFFYRDRYSTTDPAVLPYLSDDVKLDAFTTHTFEAKLGVLGEAFGAGGRWSGARFEGILSYVAQDNRFGNAIIAHVALTVPLDY
ncbi:MAG: DUF3570 domain-containing protein [Myxococcales bacterium]|nr:DUF3570 domain-containing protein [Myxococcales bacterium]